MSAQSQSDLAICVARSSALAILAVAEFAGAQTASALIRKLRPTTIDFHSVPGANDPGRPAAARAGTPAIANSAQFYGYTVDSSYSYREIACPVAPNDCSSPIRRHLRTAPSPASPRSFVRGRRRRPAGSHPVAQIIPIFHFGVVPFIPAIANPHSIEVFNAAISPAPSATEVLSANQAGNQPLLVRALCYLAMVGEEPAAPRSPSSSQATIHAPIPTLVFRNKGRFANRSPSAAAPTLIRSGR